MKETIGAIVLFYFRGWLATFIILSLLHAVSKYLLDVKTDDWKEYIFFICFYSFLSWVGLIIIIVVLVMNIIEEVRRSHGRRR